MKIQGDEIDGDGLIVDISPTLPMSIPSSLEIQTTIGLSAVVNQQLLESVNIVPIPQGAMIGIPTQIDMKQLKKSIREAGKVDHKPQQQQQPSETRVFIDEYSIFHGHKMFQNRVYWIHQLCHSLDHHKPHQFKISHRLVR